MFVKIVEIDRSGEILDIPETVYDCVKYRFHGPCTAGESEGGWESTVSLDLRLSNGETCTFTVDCEKNRVYIMNNEGLTIDRKSWK